MVKATNVDADSVGSVTGASIILTTETTFTLYVIPRSGAHNNHRIGLEISPDGTVWVPLAQSILGSGCITVQHGAASVRPVITEVEGATSIVDIHLIVR